MGNVANVVVIGGGPTGLTAAMEFAGLGASVLVLERDPGALPESAEEAWEGWDRRAVTQFRQVHYLQPAGRHVLEQHCPAVIEELVALGGIRQHVDVLFGAPDPGEPDPRYETITTARRPVLELAFARAAERTPGVEVRRGAVVEALVTGPDVTPGVPHVTGVRLTDGQVVTADLVIDAGGRRSAVGAMIRAAGGRAMPETSTEVGFVYTTRYYRGEHPDYRSDSLTPLGSISALTMLGDDDTWAITLYSHPADKPLRRLRDPEVFDRVVRCLPDHAHWIEGEPLGEPKSLTSTANTVRDFVVDDVPVATGLLPVGDAHAFTNPSLGRGIAIGVMHAVDVAKAVAPVLDAPLAVAKAWQVGTTTRVADFVASTVQYDVVRAPEVEAAIRGEVHEHTDPAAQMATMLDAARHRNQQVFEDWRDVATLQSTLTEVLGRDGLFDRVLEHGAEPWMRNAPSRDVLLEALG